MFGARHSVTELLESCVYLSTKFNSWTRTEDAGLLWAFGYVQMLLDTDMLALTL